jgi:hypothetical protein
MWSCTFRDTEGVSIPQLSNLYSKGTVNEGRMCDCPHCTKLRGGKGFFSSTKPVHSGPRDHTAYSSRYRSSSRGQWGRGVALTAHHNQAPSLGNNGAKLHSPTVFSWQATGRNLTICTFIVHIADTVSREGLLFTIYNLFSPRFHSKLIVPTYLHRRQLCVWRHTFWSI